MRDIINNECNNKCEYKKKKKMNINKIMPKNE